ncbi:hypothetical protein FD41_GL001663 [Lentilactobacillus farraginis DSM 18382 = JCM 14108]|uniref:Uncharacterized protein n=1 Tax=Lentilactobacillus farraginis DSM 18382 = JCM 14108 TaxID=1423743 RepID=X0PFF2_9LACO|nr:hypothetical protein FD41_GL001663 [Lentilactobacillus farraginis DSM 18382 = JCM 14108]GAF35587.1 hypothetical protein JCM14108_481 [Lentilactobacillus farraginis DSM 18382 = JCM 14108]
MSGLFSYRDALIINLKAQSKTNHKCQCQQQKDRPQLKTNLLEQVYHRHHPNYF